MAAERIARRWRWIAALAAAALALALVAWLGHAGSAQPPSAAPSPPARPLSPQLPDTHPLPAAPAPQDRSARRRLLIEQVRLADHTYCSYLQATEYPHGSRPISEHPDQIWPNAPVVELGAMRQEGGGSNPDIQIQTSQSRVHLGAGESVQLALRALDGQGNTLPLTVSAALAQGLTFQGARPAPQAALQFVDDGTAGDAQAGDGVHSAVFTPAQSALAGFEGTIRARVRYSVAGKAGAVLFDVVYTPQAPAVWTGPVREAMEDGSLSFYLKLDVRQPGRYVVHGRVDDARGTPLALLTFNDVLAAGPGEVKFSMFGKLVRDHTPAMPLTLRDVDGYLLRENADPDRATLPRLAGRVHTSRSHPIRNFSVAAWHSPERTRYLNELGADRNRARAALGQFDPATVLAPPCKAPLNSSPGAAVIR